MPEISRFLGIIICMYYDDHNPPHFHARYGEYMITVDIETGIIKGDFPKRALSAVMEWYDLHREDLKTDWNRAEKDLPLIAIKPLE
ncbi:MAG: DUF4160 domain-containing protein [Alphaproteobacteria bacterium]|nr:DUF4160 domain-containing protein [Alphaproteobacteria bacterium]